MNETGTNERTNEQIEMKRMNEWKKKAKVINGSMLYIGWYLRTNSTWLRNYIVNIFFRGANYMLILVTVNYSFCTSVLIIYFL